MRINEIIAKLLRERDRTYRWLHRQTGISYRRLLRVGKSGEQPLSLVDAATIADALEVNISVLTSGMRDAGPDVDADAVGQEAA